MLMSGKGVLDLELQAIFERFTVGGTSKAKISSEMDDLFWGSCGY